MNGGQCQVVDTGLPDTGQDLAAGSDFRGLHWISILVIRA